jgi:hypothetical protein
LVLFEKIRGSNHAEGVNDHGSGERKRGENRRRAGTRRKENRQENYGVPWNTIGIGKYVLSKEEDPWWTTYSRQNREPGILGLD